MMTTTSDFMKEFRALAQRVAAASRDHALLPEIRRECQRSLVGIDPESTVRASADYRAGQAEILLAVLTAIEERTEGHEPGMSRKQLVVALEQTTVELAKAKAQLMEFAGFAWKLHESIWPFCTKGSVVDAIIKIQKKNR